MREEWIAGTTKALEATQDEWGKDYFAALLGDAKAAIKVCSQPPYSDYAEYRAWLREAKRKSEGEATRSRRR